MPLYTSVTNTWAAADSGTMDAEPPTRHIILSTDTSTAFSHVYLHSLAICSSRMGFPRNHLSRGRRPAFVSKRVGRMHGGLDVITGRGLAEVPQGIEDEKNRGVLISKSPRSALGSQLLTAAEDRGMGGNLSCEYERPRRLVIHISVYTITVSNHTIPFSTQDTFSWSRLKLFTISTVEKSPRQQVTSVL